MLLGDGYPLTINAQTIKLRELCRLNSTSGINETGVQQIMSKATLRGRSFTFHIGFLA